MEPVEKFDLMRPWLTLDPWQKEYIENEGDCLLVCGRQVGKTTAMSIKIGNLSMRPNKDILIGALTEKQAYQLYFKALTYVQARWPKRIMTGKDKPTKHEFRIKHKEGNSVVRAYALGLTGMGMRTFTITDLFIDECREIAREVFVSLEPMISVTRGRRNYASTPGGKIGYFYEASKNPSFTKYHVSAFDCPRHDMEFLKKQQTEMSKLSFAQEYLGQFLDDVLRVFPDELLQQVMVLQRTQHTAGKYYGGVDVARLGADASTFEILNKLDEKNMLHVEHKVTRKELTTQTTQNILELHKVYKCRQWGVDGAGVGAGVVDQLLLEPSIRDKVIDLNNASKHTDAEGKKSKKLLKEEMYINLLRLLQHGYLKLLDDESLLESLISVMYEYDDKGVMKIFGSNTHAAEGLIRAAWCAAQDKTLNLWATSYSDARFSRGLRS